MTLSDPCWIEMDKVEAEDAEEKQEWAVKRFFLRFLCALSEAWKSFRKSLEQWRRSRLPHPLPPLHSNGEGVHAKCDGGEVEPERYRCYSNG